MVAVLAVGLRGQGGTPVPPTLTDHDCLELVTVVVAAENASHSVTSPMRLTPVETIVKFRPQYHGESLGGDAAKFPGYNLRVTRSGDGSHFQVALTPQSACATAWFAAEDSIVYSGRRPRCTQ